MKIHLLTFIASIFVSTLYSQNSQELESINIYGDLSEYLSWPLSATAFSGDDLSMHNRNNDRDLADLIPNFSKTNTGVGSFGDVISIRGLTNTPFFGPPSLVQYVDGVPSGNTSTHTASFYGTDKVEVLRGAQSTMFGLNSYGGVMRIESRKPSDHLEASLKTTLAEYDSLSIIGTLMGPLNDENTISYRLGLKHYERDGVMSNPFLGISPDHKNQFSFNGSIFFNPNEKLEISVSASFEDFNDGAHRLTPLTGDPFIVSSDIAGQSNQDSDSLSLTIKNSGDSIDFLSVTASKNWEINPYVFDLDFSSNPGNRSSIIQSQDSISQEFQFSSTDNDIWEWSVGGYYGDTKIAGNTTRDFIIPLPPEFGGGFSPVTTTTNYNLDEKTHALFGQLTYNAMQDIGIHFGLRGDQYDKSIYRTALGLSGIPDPIDLNSNYSFLSPRAGIDFDLSGTSLLYLNTGSSYKPGGYSAFVDDPDIANFKEEKSWTKEVGLKKRWLDDKVRTNMAIFHHDIDNYQVERSLIATDYAVLNADEAESYGAEIELTAKLFTGLTLEGSLGKIKTELTKFKDPITGDNISGNKAPFVPELDASIAANYLHESGLFARVELIHQGEVYYSDINRTTAMEDGFTVLNATIGYRSDSGYELSLFGTNINDETYYVQISPDLNAGALGLPRMFGIRATWNY